MAIAPEGTFDYTFDVSDSIGKSAQLEGRPRGPLPRGTRRLVGHAPLLECIEYQPEPWQLFARITLIASDAQNAAVKSVSFSVERGLVRVMHPGDILHMSRTGCGGMALSILRSDRLIAAAGAITAVPLGVDVTARHPWDLVRQAEAIFRTRDPRYQRRDSPVELSVEGVTRIVYAGRRRMGPYDIHIRHGFLDGTPGTNECLSIERCGVCPDTAAHTSAQLLEEDGLQIIRREER
jgi:hypothetical protein